MPDTFAKILIITGCFILLVLTLLAPRILQRRSIVRGRRRAEADRIYRKGELFAWSLRWAPRPRRITHQSDKKTPH